MLGQVVVKIDYVDLNIPLALQKAYLPYRQYRGGAIKMAQRVLTDARDRKGRGFEALALWLLGNCHAW